MTPEAQQLAQALLDHHRKFCRLQSVETSNTESCLIAYGDLSDLPGVSQLKPMVGKVLLEVAQRFQNNGWPPLNALAVNHDTQRPGQGYDRAPGCNRETWQDEVAAVINFAGYPDFIS